jgi:hypothetical protein
MESRSAKTSLLFTIIGAAVWLGGINVRAIIGGDLLEFGSIEFRPNIHPMVERATFGLIAKSSLVVLPAYIVTIIGSIVFLKTTNYSIKHNGWLMMSAILLYIFAPVEIYTLALDAKMIYLDLIVSSSDLVEFRKLFIHRLAALSGAPIVALFCYYTIIALVVLQPLKKT